MSAFDEYRDVLEDEALTVVRAIMVNPKGKTSDKLKAAGMILDRTSPAMKSIEVRGQLPVTIIYESVQIGAREVLALQAGEQANVIDVEIINGESGGDTVPCPQTDTVSSEVPTELC